MQVILMFNVDGGDGSSTTRFIKDGPGIQARLEEKMDEDPETYAASEGFSVLKFPDDLDLAECGLNVHPFEYFFDED